LVSLVRAVLVWAVVLATVLAPRLLPQSQAPAAPVVTQISTYHQQSVLESIRLQHIQTTEAQQADSWSQEYLQGWNKYQAQVQALAEAQAEAARIAALSNHPAAPADIAKAIHDAFAPLGDRALQWAFNVAWCESRYHPTSVNSSSGAAGLFQFLPSTWAFTPEHTSSPFDPVANSLAAAWLYNRDGPSQWVCQG
jgi:transglycosylase-like protein with SLT domain